jgi:hypothetical protein
LTGHGSNDARSVPTDIRLRLAFESAHPEKIARWVHLLTSAGVSVIGASGRSIDLRGTIAAIEEALDTKINLDGKIPLVGEVRRRIGRDDDTPLAYVPQKPQSFP